MTGIDVNADLGEGFDDARLAPHLSSCSIACGGHAGDVESMARTLRLAADHGLRAGAHPSYPDRAGFGRAPLEMPARALVASLRAQIQDLAGVAARLGLRLSHVKPHGALYNVAWDDPATAAAVAEAVVAVDPGLALMCPAGSALALAAAAHGLPVVREVFLDRGHGGDGRLLPRSAPGAVLTDPSAVPVRLAELSGLEFDTMCVHGDNPAALELLRRLDLELPRAGLVRRPYPLPPAPA
jgi:UPF0271 protein